VTSETERQVDESQIKVDAPKIQWTGSVSEQKRRLCHSRRKKRQGTGKGKKNSLRKCAPASNFNCPRGARSGKKRKQALPGNKKGRSAQAGRPKKEHLKVNNKRKISRRNDDHSPCKQTITVALCWKGKWKKRGQKKLNGK